MHLEVCVSIVLVVSAHSLVACLPCPRRAVLRLCLSSCLFSSTEPGTWWNIHTYFLNERRKESEGALLEVQKEVQGADLLASTGTPVLWYGVRAREFRVQDWGGPEPGRTHLRTPSSFLTTRPSADVLLQLAGCPRFPLCFSQTLCQVTPCHLGLQGGAPGLPWGPFSVSRPCRLQLPSCLHSDPVFPLDLFPEATSCHLRLLDVLWSPLSHLFPT